MSTLSQLWERYCENPEDEKATKELRNRIEKHARRILKEYKLYEIDGNTYEDLIQQAFACFFEIVHGHDANKGTLAGFFIYSFRSNLIKIIKRPKLVVYGESYDAVDWKRTPLDNLLFEEVNREIEQLLSVEELNVLNQYLKEGITDYNKIAELEGVSVNDVKWAVDSMQNKIRQYLDKEYNHYGYGETND